jgi:hypothetical protein
MNFNQKVLAGILIVLLSGITLYGQPGSTSAIRLVNKRKIEKANGDVPSYVNMINQRMQGVEQLKQGKFTIVLNPGSNGQYELQVYRMVLIGKKKVMSLFSSLYKSGIEYSYSYDAGRQEIQQYHFICPPNSLTCWSDPQDYEILKKFKWNEDFPAKNCQLSVFTSEEYGREYVQASCFPGRDAAISFAQNFIQYVSGDRM